MAHHGPTAVGWGRANQSMPPDSALGNHRKSEAQDVVERANVYNSVTGGVLMPPLVATFSIVGCDTAVGEVGVAVQSKFLAVGAVVPWARAGVGAVATQARANTSYGPAGLRYLAAGLSPQDALDRLTGADPDALHRQAGIVDAQGRSATFTGSGCIPWAGGRVGACYAAHAAQGNILVGGATVDAMAATFEATAGTLA